jgi:YYY domain-containing protein
MQQEASFPSHSGTTLVTRLTNVAKSRFAPIFWLILILIMAGWFRFTGLDWDEEKHLHPDERFLTMVTAAMEWPESFDNYFDPLQSELSPYRNDPEVWYVYGTLPIMITKWASTVVEMEGYDKVYLVGRALSGILDLGCILFIFLIGQRLYDDKVGLLGAGLYALAVHPIQLSHFYAVDTFANFFVVMTMYWAVRASEKGNWWFYVLMGISLGAGMASKLSVVTLGVVVVLAGMLDFARFYRRTSDVHSSLEHLLARWSTVGILLLLVFRILQPIAFEGPSFFNFRFSEIWRDDIDQMKNLVEGEFDIPPFVQWADRDTFLFPLQNIVLWGLGLPLGLAAWGGWLLGGYHILRHRNPTHLLPVAYIGVAFVYHSLQWVKYMRYFMPIYPLLALMAGYLIMWLWRQAWHSRQPKHLAQPAQTPPHQQVWQWFLKGAAVLLAIVVPVGTLLYALAFTSIYNRPVSRITASRWMYEHIPQGSVIANEHWDDDLPLRVDGKDGYRDWYSSVEIKNYDHYSPEKVNSLVNSLTEADYISLSSNRLYDSVTRLPQRYPVATRYYQLLFAEQLGFAKVAEFTSYPQLFGIELPDQSADESFTVYDHPKVMIFKKTADFDPEQVRQLLTADIDWYTYFHTTPRKMTLAPHGIMFDQEDRHLYQQYGTWSEMFTPESLANRVPLLVWALAIQLLGVVAFPLVWGIFHRLEDRGYIFAKAIGLLLVGWIAWLLASWRVMLFTRSTLLLSLLIVVVASVVVVALRYREIIQFLRHRWRLLLLQEGVFWLFFALFAFLRWRNPDIVSAYESRTSFDYLATLNAIIKTPYFPAYDPWYAGGFLNGSSFGLMLVAVLVKLTGILPEVAYNLALPTWAALTVGGVWSVAFHLAQGWRETWYATKPKQWAEGSLSGALLAGGLAVLFVMLFGNLNLVHFLLNLEGNLDFNKYLEVTRIIPKVPSEPELITSFPLFAFIHGELQAHILALPYLLLVIVLAVHTIRIPIPSSINPDTDIGRTNEDTNQPHPWQARLRHLLPQVANEAIVLVPLALATGALALLNNVDWFIGVVLAVAALAIRLYHQREQEQATVLTQYRQKRYAQQRSWSLATLPARLRWQSRPTPPTPNGESRRWNAPTPDVVALLLNLLWRVIVVVGLGKLLFYPFHATYAPLIDGIQRWEGEHVPLSAFLVINGFFLFIIGTFLVQEIWQPRQNALVRLLRMFWRHWRRIPRVWQRYETLVQPGVWFELGLYAVLFPAALLILLVLFKLWTIAVVLLILLVTTLLLVRPFADPQRQLTLGLIAIGCGIILFSEVATYKEFEAIVKDPYRQLTIFISYFQVWVIWGIASAVALMVLIERLPVFFSAIERGSVQSAIEQLPVVSWLVAQVWWLLLIVLVVASLHYPLFGTVNLLQKQAATDQEPTFDSMAYMQQERYTHFGFDFSMQPDYDAIHWMRQHIPGSPVIAEATHPQETWAGRVSVYTGLPVIVGWRDAVQYRRSLLPGNMVDERQRDLEAIYLDADPDVARSLLKKHAVSYVYVGPLERQVFRGVGVEKFGTYAGAYWDLVYENAEVQIYRVLDDG